MEYVRNAGTWKPVKGVYVKTTKAKAVWLRVGGAWRRVWVFPVTTATLSLSMSGVDLNETFSLYLDAPGGYPAQTTVQFTSGSTTLSASPAEGATRASVSTSHASSGSFAWTATVTTLGGVTSFGPVNQTVAPSYTYDAFPGQSSNTIQNAMNAKPAGSTFRFSPGAYTLTNNSSNTGRECSLVIPKAMTIVATGCTFTHRSPISNAGTGGGYSRVGGWTWDGGDFNCGGVANTAFSVGHCPSFTIQNTTIYNTEFEGHGIEINSSGGPPSSKSILTMVDADFTVQILNNTFKGSDSTPRSTDQDEAIHIDYSWDGASVPVNPANDGTVCNNVLVRGNRVYHDASMTYSYPVGFGTHHAVNDSSGGRARPDAQHKHIKVTANSFENVKPRSVSNGRGAVHIRNSMTSVWVYDNYFGSCAMGTTLGLVDLDGRGFPAAANIYITSNEYRSCNGSVPWVDTDSTETGSNDVWVNLQINSNKFTGTIPAGQSTYLIACRHVSTLSVQLNQFWGLTGNTALAAQNGNRIYGTPAAPAPGTTNMTLANNTWAYSADGTGAVVANS